MTDQSIQLAYLSFATRKFKINADENIEQIIEEAQAHNGKHNITGQLIYRAGVFVQLLEGDKQEVQRLLGGIAADRARHENITVLFQQPMENRVFPDWSMAYKKLDDQSLDLVNAIVPWQKIVRMADNGEAVATDKIFEVFKNLRDKAQMEIVKNVS